MYLFGNYSVIYVECTTPDHVLVIFVVRSFRAGFNVVLSNRLHKPYVKKDVSIEEPWDFFDHDENRVKNLEKIGTNINGGIKKFFFT